jgi:GTP-binding protein
MFVDFVGFEVVGGKGGNGCVSFRREKFIEFGGPDGGSGGEGGDVIIRANNNLTTLLDFTQRKLFKAKNGLSGSGARRTGAKGEDLILEVPVGTQVFDQEINILLADLQKHGDEILIAKGGKGGAGNAVFKSSTNQTPEKAVMGSPGEEKFVSLCLKIFCDIGLVGFPNAGKSSLLAALTRATPKIANYPFTTLNPNIGVVDIKNYDQFVIGDIPGLIEGASEGKGLGDRFLQHVERCKALFHLVSLENENLLTAYKIIRNELAEYDKMALAEGIEAGLCDKHEVVLISKTDTLLPEEISDKSAELVDFLRKNNTEFMFVSTFNPQELELAREKMSQVYLRLK